MKDFPSVETSEHVWKPRSCNFWLEVVRHTTYHNPLRAQGVLLLPITAFVHVLFSSHSLSFLSSLKYVSAIGPCFSHCCHVWAKAQTIPSSHLGIVVTVIWSLYRFSPGSGQLHTAVLDLKSINRTHSITLFPSSDSQKPLIQRGKLSNFRVHVISIAQIIKKFNTDICWALYFIILCFFL